MRNSDKIRLICFILALCAALAYPVRKIISFEYPAVPPKIYLFDTEIRDPYDPMRGRYVQLLIKQSRVWLSNKNTSLMAGRSGTPCFAILEKNPDGMARIVDLVTDVKQIPAGKDFIRVKYLYFQQEYEANSFKPKKTGDHVIQFPFDRFYLNERLAPEAERELQASTRKGQAYLRVKVYHNNGNFAVDDLIVNGQPILERLRGKAAKKP